MLDRALAGTEDLDRRAAEVDGVEQGHGRELHLGLVVPAREMGVEGVRGAEVRVRETEVR
jgi:hypothetical protein